MSILDANADSLALSADNLIAPPPLSEQPSTFAGFAKGAGTTYMQSMAKLARSASMAVGALPVAADWATSPDSVLGQAVGEHGLQDRYFKWHDQFFGKAVDFWTPKPGEVGTAGQIVGQLTGGLAKFLANPALAVADAQLSTSEDLVRQGVGAGTAQVAGAISGVGTAVGIRAPAAVGNTLVQRLASGAAINVLQAGVSTEAQRLALQAGGAPEPVIAEFNPLDLKARTVDALMGLAFGGVAHVQSKALTQTQRDAIMLVNQAKALEDGSLPGRPATQADLTQAVDNTRAAMEQMARGEPVNVGEMPAHEFDPQKAADRAEVGAIAKALPEAAAPIERPAMAEPTTQPGAEAAPAAQEPGAKAAPAPQFPESVRVPTGEFDPKTGESTTMPANEFVAKAQAEASQIKATAPGLLKTAADCLLGLL